MKARAGFTVLELLLVLILTGVMLTMMQARTDERELAVRGADRQLHLMLLGSQQRAVLRQHDVRVVFDTAGRQLILHDDRDNDGVTDAGEAQRYEALPQGVYFTVLGTPSTGAAVTFRSDAQRRPVVTFRRNGAAAEAGSIHLGTVRSATGQVPSDARQFRLERATGRAARHHLQGGTWQRIRVR